MFSFLFGILLIKIPSPLPLHHSTLLGLNYILYHFYPASLNVASGDRTFLGKIKNWHLRPKAEDAPVYKKQLGDNLHIRQRLQILCVLHSAYNVNFIDLPMFLSILKLYLEKC